jgi:nitrate reductase (NAD(P)H)
MTLKMRLGDLKWNRLEENILCRDDMDVLVKGKEDWCRLLYSLTQPTDAWIGLIGRVGMELQEKEVGSFRVKNGE